VVWVGGVGLDEKFWANTTTPNIKTKRRVKDLNIIPPKK
jgi:hypothetical protein